MLQIFRSTCAAGILLCVISASFAQPRVPTPSAVLVVAGVAAYRPLNLDQEASFQVMLCEGEGFTFVLQRDTADLGAAGSLFVLENQAGKMKLFENIGREVVGATFLKIERYSNVARLVAAVTAPRRRRTAYYERGLPEIQDAFRFLDFPAAGDAVAAILRASLNSLPFSAVHAQLHWSPTAISMPATFVLDHVATPWTRAVATQCIASDFRRLPRSLKQQFQTRVRQHRLLAEFFDFSQTTIQSCSEGIRFAEGPNNRRARTDTFTDREARRAYFRSNCHRQVEEGKIRLLADYFEHQGELQE